MSFSRSPPSEKPVVSQEPVTPTDAPAHGSERAPEPFTGAPAAAFPSDTFVRVVTAVALLAAFLGTLVLPGLLGNVGDKAVMWGERAAAVSSYLAFFGLLSLTSYGGYDLILRAEIGAARFVLLGLSVIIVGLAAPAVATRLLAVPQAALGLIVAVFAVIAAVVAVRAPHTRAPAGVLALVGLSAFFRAVSWIVAQLSLDNPLGFAFGRAFATVGVVVAGGSQLVAIAYFATRGRSQGRLLGNAALALGFFVTYVGAKKPAFAGALGHVLSGALAHAVPSPEPFGLTPVATFLFPTALFFGLVACAQRGQVALVACGLGLALATQGRFDVPLASLFALVSGLLLVRASQDRRSLWSDLMASGPRREKAPERPIKNARASDRPPPPEDPPADVRAEVSAEPTPASAPSSSEVASPSASSEPKALAASSEPDAPVEPVASEAPSDPVSPAASSEPDAPVAPDAPAPPEGEPKA